MLTQTRLSPNNNKGNGKMKMEKDRMKNFGKRNDTYSKGKMYTRS